MEIYIKFNRLRKYITSRRYDSIELFFAMQAMAVSERYHFCLGVLTLFIGFVISAMLNDDKTSDAE